MASVSVRARQEPPMAGDGDCGHLEAPHCFEDPLIARSPVGTAVQDRGRSGRGIPALRTEGVPALSPIWQEAHS